MIYINQLYRFMQCYTCKIKAFFKTFFYSISQYSENMNRQNGAYCVKKNSWKLPMYVHNFRNTCFSINVNYLLKFFTKMKQFTKFWDVKPLIFYAIFLNCHLQLYKWNIATYLEKKKERFLLLTKLYVADISAKYLYIGNLYSSWNNFSPIAQTKATVIDSIVSTGLFSNISLSAHEIFHFLYSFNTNNMTKRLIKMYMTTV